MHHFNNIIAGESKFFFNQLSDELLTRILSHTHLNCENEKSILHIISNWISEQATAIPESKIIQLLYCVRFKHLNCTDLQEVATLPFIQNSTFLSQLLSAMILKLRDTEENTDEPKHYEKCKKIQQENLEEVESLSDDDVLLKNQQSSERSEKRLLPCCFALSCHICHKSSGKRNSEVHIANCDVVNTHKFSSEIINLMSGLLDVPGRQLPLVPCVVGHVRCLEPKTG